MARQSHNVEKNAVLELVVGVLLILVLFALSLAIFANAMTKPLGRDEHMYCTAGALMSQGKLIYRDFTYVAQLPYHPLLLGAIYKVFDTTRYLLAGRLVCVICDILTMLCIVLVFRRAFKGHRIYVSLFGMCGALLYVYNPVVDYANGYAWNNDVVVFCVILSVFLFGNIEPDKKSRFWYSAAIGVLLTMATFMRMTTIVVEGLFLIMLLALPAGRIAGRIKNALPFLVVSLILSIWPIWIIVQSPRAFIVGAFRIHMLNSQWLQQIGMVFEKTQMGIALLTQPGYFLLLIAFGFILVAVITNSLKHKMPNLLIAVLPALIATFYFILAFGLPTIWRQYLAPPVPFIIIALAYPLSFLRETAAKQGRRLLYIVGVVLFSMATLVAMAFGPNNLDRIAMLGNSAQWTPMQVHSISKDIAAKVGESKLILTAAPLYAIEGGCKIYPEFSAGIFPYRIGELLTDKERTFSHTVGPKGIGVLVEKSPPAAVLVGIEPSQFKFLEEPFRAVPKEDWKSKTYGNGLTLYYKP
ncbi:MAG: glycosyltransferase family 39 protein [Sedimentisphaerales bacterium]|nr:glycosyltransferase family 39 protein [Sedimentisphaerales bacterium]